MITDTTIESTTTTKIGRADQSSTSLRRYVAIVAQDRSTRRAQAVVSLEIASPQPSHEFLRVTPVIEGFRVSVGGIEGEGEPCHVPGMFRVSVNGIDGVELDRGVMSGDALDATVSEMFDARAHAAQLFQWKIVHGGVTRLSGVFSEAEMVAEIVSMFVNDAYNQVELIPLAPRVARHQSTLGRHGLHDQIGRLVGNAALIVKKFRLSPTFQIARIPFLWLPGAESEGCWGLIRDDAICWTMRDASEAKFWFMLLEVNFGTPSITKVFREIPVRFDDATITWKDNVFCDIWGQELNDVESFRDAVNGGEWDFVMEELVSFGGVGLSPRMSPEFLGIMLNVTYNTVEEREEDPTPLYPGPLGLLQLNAYYRLLHNLIRVVNGVRDPAKICIKVRCDGSPMVIVFSSLADVPTSESPWRVKGFRDGGAQGTFRQICAGIFLDSNNLENSEWMPWFDTSRRRLHITAK
jgi:hypothetical protein